MPPATLDNAAMSMSQNTAQPDHEGSAPMMKKGFSAKAPPSDDDDTVSFRQRSRTWNYVWRSGLAGGLAGCAAKTIVAPLDRVKILFQASSPQYAKYSGSWAGVAATLKDIYHHDGSNGLFRGHSATLLRIFPYAAIKFLAYEQIRSAVIQHKGQETPSRRFISGSLAGVTSVFFTYPLELIRVRMAFETSKEGRPSISSICRQIYNERPTAPAAATIASNPAKAVTDPVNTMTPRWGISNFYRGFTPTLLGMLPYAGVSFLTHDTVSDLFRHPAIAKWSTLPRRRNTPEGKAVPLRSWAELTAGGVAGLISQTASYPMEILRRRMQVSGVMGDGRRLRIGETAAIVFRERGVSGFFVGLSIGYVKIIPMSAVAFYVYERSKGLLGI